jgi:hypothetical protein
MPTKRRKLASRRIGLSAAAISGWQIGDYHMVNRELGVRPWQVSPFDAGGNLPGRCTPGDAWCASWPRAVELRAALIAVAGPPGRMDRHGQPLGPAKARKTAETLG